MTLRLAPEQDQRLTEVANALGLSKHQAIEKALDEYLDRQSQSEVIGRIVDMVLIRDKELLDRLADA